MRAGVLVVTGLVLAAAACVPPAPTVDVAAETEALRAAAAGYDAAVEALDATAMAAFYAADSRAMPANEPTMMGPAGMKAFVETVAAIEGFSVDMSPPEVVVAKGGDMGYTVATIQVTAPGPDGTLVTTNERDVHIWRKEPDGSWKIVVDIWNPEGP